MLSAAARACLADAVDRIIADWESLRGDALTRDEVDLAVRDVAGRIADAADARAATPEPHEAVVSPLARRCLIALRRRVVHAPPPMSSDDLLPLLRAIEAVSEAFEPRWDGRFHDRMTGPNGLDLVVEVAHDLRSPLTSILFLAETMLRGRSGPLTTLQERQLGLVYSAAFGLNAVASDVIELVRGGDRLADLERVQFSVAEALESVEQIVQPIAEEKGLTLRIERPAHDLRLGHPAALGRVLLNLTTNALKFTGSGEVLVSVRELATDVSRLRIAVRDTGHGIPEGAIATLFEPFRRRQRAGDYAFSGTGLGLSICRKMVEGMGATLELETASGEGTTFWFEIEAPVASEGLLRTI
jgi:signal transduction histidine kinase